MTKIRKSGGRVLVTVTRAALLFSYAGNKNNGVRVGVAGDF